MVSLFALSALHQAYKNVKVTSLKVPAPILKQNNRNRKYNKNQLPIG